MHDRRPEPPPPRRRDWRHYRVSPRAFRLIALAAVWALVLTIISGAAVRLTGSGLGCPDWPDCTRTSLVAPLQYHAWVEFGNRLINAAVTIASLGALAAALLRAPRRRDLTWLSAGLVAGLFAEVVVGGLTVEFKLAPGFVMTHFLLAVVFLADAVVLHHRSAIPDGPTEAAPLPRRVPLVGRGQMLLARLLLVATATVITLGTIVTSTGPHGGDPRARRFGFSLHSVAQLHGTSVELLLGITVLTLWSLGRCRAPRRVLLRAEVLLAVLVAQAAVGYSQYLIGDPVQLVAVHVAGACSVVVAVLWFYLGLSAQPAVVPATAATSPAEVAGAHPAGAPTPHPAGMTRP
ncbi:MAG: COX15/CtaA family protein [Acidimicrobiales bacterium]